MPSPTKGPRLGGSPSHQRIILGNLASQLFEHRRLVTTEAKAKRLRPLAEKLITKAKRGDLHARRQVMRVIRENDERSIVHTLFTDIAPGFADRAGGYVRITKVGPRKGDNAPMAVIELVTETVEEGRTSRADAARKTAKKAPAKRAAGRAGARPLADEPPAGAAVADQPVTDQVAADQPVTDQVAADQPGTGQVAADQPATDQVAADQPATYQAAGTDQPGTEQAAATDQAVPTDQEVAADAEELAPEEMAADAAEAAEDADEQPGAPR